jgi:hypothetical protein
MKSGPHKKSQAKHANHGESIEHRLLKVISSRALEAEGYAVQMEERVDDSFIDVLGKNGTQVSVVECEALRERQKRNLRTRFKKILLSFPNLKRILCIPKIVEFDEIWVVDVNSGSLTRYNPIRVKDNAKNS